MKKSILLLLLLTSSLSYSQIITEDIDFNNYVNSFSNDLNNHFYGNHSLVADPNYGITGGSLVAPDSNNWGNDISTYCSKFRAVNFASNYTSVCFYYDASTIAAGFDRATSIWLRPHADPNHYLIFSVSHDAKIIIYTYYSTEQSLAPMNLQSGHWYRLEAGIYYSDTPFNYLVSFHGKVEDLGTTGTSTPVLMDSIYNDVQDTVFFQDNTVEISLTAARFGGCSYLDNFHFLGWKSTDSCNFTGIHPGVDLATVKFNVRNNTIYVDGNDLSGKEIHLFNYEGKNILSEKLVSGENHFDISFLNTGVYMVSAGDEKSRKNFKFNIIR